MMKMKIYPYKQLEKNKVYFKSELHCTACGRLTPVETCGNGPDNGLHLTGFAGYYGGFTDYTHPSFFDGYSVTEEDVKESESHNNAWFCHNCCIRLFDTFPHLARAVGIINPGSMAHHPCMDEVPCCMYSYHFKRSPYFEDDIVQYEPCKNPDTGKLEWVQAE
jgi:hypothetical protein